MNKEMIGLKEPKDPLAERVPSEQPKIQAASIATEAMPNRMGGVTIGIFGLGTDNVMYMWAGDRRLWVVA